MTDGTGTNNKSEMAACMKHGQERTWPTDNDGFLTEEKSHEIIKQPRGRLVVQGRLRRWRGECVTVIQIFEIKVSDCSF